MVQLIARKLFLLLLLVPFLHALGFHYAATTHPIMAMHPGEPMRVTVEYSSDVTAHYLEYVEQILAGDFGKVGSGSITEIIATGLRNSGILLLLASLIITLLGPLFGILSISSNTRRLRPSAFAVTIGGMSLPGFFLGVSAIALMIYGIFYFRRGELPLPISGYGLDEHLILPVLVLAVSPMLQVARVTAGMLEHELQQDYVRVARSKGLSWLYIYVRHALPNIISSVTLTAGRSARVLISGLVIVEVLFLWPGLGRMFTYSVGIRIDGRDAMHYFLNPYLLANLAVIFGVALLLADFIASVVAYTSDPILRQPLPKGERR